MTRSSPMAYLGSLGFRGRRAPQAPSVNEVENERLDAVVKGLRMGQLYLVKNILNSKTFFKYFSPPHNQWRLMGYVGTTRGELRKGILTSLPDDMLTRIIRDKLRPSSFIMSDPSSSSSEIGSDSQLPLELRSDAMLSKFDLKRLARRPRRRPLQTLCSPTGGKGIHIGDRPSKKSKTTLRCNLGSFSVQGETPPKAAKKVKYAAYPRSLKSVRRYAGRKGAQRLGGRFLEHWAYLDPTTSRVVPARLAGGKEGTLVHLGAVLGLEFSVVKNPVVEEKLTQAFLLPADKKMTGKMELEEAELMTDKECYDLALVRLEKEVAYLKRDEESSDLAAEKFMEEVAELKRKENLAKKLAIDKFKVSEEYKEVVEEEVPSYFGEGFDLCKKQLSPRFLDIDIDDMQIISIWLMELKMPKWTKMEL
ncbi:hypothetical protein Acr_20g0005520 [Actinidia rufa]|uniref:Uncharacterized protein n=1 Tax=Actinidia rufa TaxID=165716 RepID=A0A7J0GD84_9ERIC|nr:hypothetical protein Acr_20g0005520 [Actinidia rufa]